MLNSLLSLYFAGSISGNPSPQITEEIEPKTEISLIQDFQLDSVLSPHAAPLKNPEMVAPVLNAKSTLSMDLKSGTILYEKNAHQRLPIASITKLMTMLIILEENALNETVTVTANAARTEGSNMNLQAGEQISLNSLLQGTLIHSANDAAVALAEHNTGSTEKFVEKMNKRALELGLVNTHYANPTGLDHPDNYSSAYDIAQLSRIVYKKDFIRNTATTPEITVHSLNKNITHRLEATNELLDSYLNIKGLKTGRTDAAGQCFSAIAQNDQNNEIITVVLNSPDRFQETKILVDWSFRAYTWPSN